MRSCVGCIVVAAALAVAGEVRGEWRVWTVAETRRALGDEPAGRSVAVKISAARNEWESFQLLVRSDSPVRGVSVEAGDLKGPGGAVLRAADARLFRQHQLHLTAGTYRNDGFKPGWYADPLIPFRHPITRKPLTGARLTAVPFDLPAGRTHGFWVDVHVPAGAAPGEYRGTYRLTAAGSKAVEVPVTMTVWDFELPRVSAMKTALGSPASRMRGYYARRAKAGKEAEPADWAAVEAQCAEMLTRHRINATPPSGSIAPRPEADGSFRVPAEQVEALRRFVDRYHVNAVMVPRPTGVVKDPRKEQKKLHAWLASWDRAAAELKRPHVVFYTYLRDEPNDEAAYKFVQEWGRAVRQAKSVVKVMVVEQTWTQDPAWGDLYGAVDIWCPLFSLFRPESAAKRQALGETIWTYTALCQAQKTPWWHIDYPLLHYRVPAWIAWRYRIRGLLYWGGMSFWQQVEDPWTDPKTLDRRK
ncbi:MAG: glycoside hydrolase domain-containing protein, partial [Phycisphaerae bacterium]